MRNLKKVYNFVCDICGVEENYESALEENIEIGIHSLELSFKYGQDIFLFKGDVCLSCKEKIFNNIEKICKNEFKQ